MTFEDYPIPKKRQGMNRSGVSSTFWATAEVFSVILKQCVFVLRSTSVNYPNRSNSKVQSTFNQRYVIEEVKALS